MRYKPLKSFWEDYAELTPELQERADKAFELFKENPRHPSLQTHHIRGTRKPKVYEGYVTKSCRFTFHYRGDTIVFRRIGPHSVIDEEARR